jgi:hypothetical protein
MTMVEGWTRKLGLLTFGFGALVLLLPGTARAFGDFNKTYQTSGSLGSNPNFNGDYTVGGSTLVTHTSAPRVDIYQDGLGRVGFAMPGSGWHGAFQGQAVFTDTFVPGSCSARITLTNALAFDQSIPGFDIPFGQYNVLRRFFLGERAVDRTFNIFSVGSIVVFATAHIWGQAYVDLQGSFGCAGVDGTLAPNVFGRGHFVVDANVTNVVHATMDAFLDVSSIRAPIQAKAKLALAQNQFCFPVPGGGRCVPTNCNFVLTTGLTVGVNVGPISGLLRGTILVGPPCPSFIPLVGLLCDAAARLQTFVLWDGTFSPVNFTLFSLGVANQTLISTGGSCPATGPADPVQS